MISYMLTAKAEQKQNWHLAAASDSIEEMENFFVEWAVANKIKPDSLKYAFVTRTDTREIIFVYEILKDGFSFRPTRGVRVDDFVKARA